MPIKSRHSFAAPFISRMVAIKGQARVLVVAAEHIEDPLPKIGYVEICKMIIDWRLIAGHQPALD